MAPPLSSHVAAPEAALCPSPRSARGSCSGDDDAAPALCQTPTPALFRLPVHVLASSVICFFSDPQDVHALCLTSSELNRMLEAESFWNAVRASFARQWGEDGPSSRTLREDVQRRSKRLKTSARLRFWRWVKCAAQNAIQVHMWLFETPKLKLTQGMMRGWLRGSVPLWVDYGGVTGGGVLLEALRSKAICPRHSLAIAQLLVDQWGADINRASADGATPLAVSAARGMSAIVAYLLSRGAWRDAKSTGSFTLTANPRKAVRGRYTPIDWALAMLHAERRSGVDERHLGHLQSCVRILQDHGAQPTLKY